MRHQLRCMHGKRVNFEFWRLEEKKVPNGYEKDKEGRDTNKKHYEKVDVKITYKIGMLHITQTPGHNSMDTAGTEFDVSAGFSVSITYHDGSGYTDVYEGWSSDKEECTVGHSAIGLTPAFHRHTLGCYERGPDTNKRKVGIDDLLRENAELCKAINVEAIGKMHQRYRDGQSKKRADREAILTAKFWPSIYNKCDLSPAMLGQWMQVRLCASRML